MRRAFQSCSIGSESQQELSRRRRLTAFVDTIANRVQVAPINQHEYFMNWTLVNGWWIVRPVDLIIYLYYSSIIKRSRWKKFESWMKISSFYWCGWLLIYKWEQMIWPITSRTKIRFLHLCVGETIQLIHFKLPFSTVIIPMLWEEFLRLGDDFALISAMMDNL